VLRLGDDGKVLASKLLGSGAAIIDLRPAG
jgi:hypothetical protein